MRPVSADFNRSVRGSHRVLVEARLVPPAQIGTDPDGITIPINDGNVVSDGNASIRSTLDLRTDGTGVWPIRPSSPYTPYGNEIFVRRGIAYGSGVSEWVSLGYFRIHTIEQDDAPDGQIRITGQDRMSSIIDGRLVAPIQFSSGTRYGLVVFRLVNEIYPSAVIEWDDDSDDILLGRQQIADEERYEFLDSLITGLGKIWFWDHRGVLVIKDPPDPGIPVFTVNHGRDGVLIRMGRQLSREGVYNAVVALGEAPDSDTGPVRAVAIDDDPRSVTFWKGPFGKVPRFFSSPSIISQNGAESAARSLLVRALGLPYNVDLTAIPNPALEPLDPVLVTYPSRARLSSARQETHVLERITIPLDAQSEMTASTREQSLVTVSFL